MKLKAVTDEQRKIDPNNINWDSINAYTSKWKPGTPIEIEIVRRQKKVSDPMRKYYFSCVLPALMNGAGYEPEEQLYVHRQLKCTYFNVKPDKRGIYREKDIPSVFSNESKLPVSVKKKFTDWVIRKAAELGEYVPDPGE